MTENEARKDNQENSQNERTGLKKKREGRTRTEVLMARGVLLNVFMAQGTMWSFLV